MSTPQPIEQREMAIIEDLLNWEEEEHDILPMTPEQIVALEAAGYIVDLRNGEVFRDPDAPRRAPRTIRSN